MWWSNPLWCTQKKNHTDISPIFYLLTVNGHLNWEVGSTPKNGKLHVKLKGPLFCFDAKIEIYFGMRSSGMISINVLGKRHICDFSFDIYSSVGKELSDASGKLFLSQLWMCFHHFFSQSRFTCKCTRRKTLRSSNCMVSLKSSFTLCSYSPFIILIRLNHTFASLSSKNVLVSPRQSIHCLENA